MGNQVLYSCAMSDGLGDSDWYHLAFYRCDNQNLFLFVQDVLCVHVFYDSCLHKSFEDKVHMLRHNIPSLYVLLAHRLCENTSCKGRIDSTCEVFDVASIGALSCKQSHK